MPVLNRKSAFDQIRDRRSYRFLLRSVVAMASLCLAAAAGAQVRITEFMASNTQTLLDEDGISSDWIELQNTTGATVSLLNWALTDAAGNTAKWLFPATNLPPRSFLVVFASGKDRRAPGRPLHTNFKLSAAGGYLALSRPDGSFATELSPGYPQQFPDVSYGLSARVDSTTLVASNSPILYRIPTNSTDDAAWTAPGFAAQDWNTGTNGLGYETGIYDPLEGSFALKVLDTQPVCYWRLNEAAGPAAVNLGAEGVGFQAGYMGGILLTNPGPRPPQQIFFESNNYAPYFNGTDAYVNGPYQLLRDLAAFSMAGWIKPTGAQNNRTGLFGQNDTVEFGFIDASTLQVWTWYGSINYPYPYPINQWHYVTVTGGNGQLALYLDGKLADAQPAVTPTFGNSDFDFNIGGGGVFDPSGNYFHGQIDEVAVWWRALSANEITTLMSTNTQQVDYAPLLNTDVRTQMFGLSASAYVLLPFTVADPAAFDSLQLLARFDDGFAAYLNGHLISASNAPVTLAWNSVATQRHLDRDAAQWTAFDVSDARAWLQAGTNTLALQGLNVNATNTDFLLQAQLVGQAAADAGADWRYFSQPTPGGPNGTGAADWGPLLSGAGHVPSLPAPTSPLVVTALVAQALSPITNVTLHYRVMFNAEATAPMNDSGTNADALAGDGVWTGIIPAGIASGGQLLRYYVTAVDASGNLSRWPIFANTAESQQYLGAVVTNAALRSDLPVVSLFVQDLAAGDTRTGTSASLFFRGELYDNISISLHGQSSASWPKKSYNIAFPKDHELLYQPGAGREKNIRLLSNYGDKSRMHTTLVYATVAKAGADGHFSFQVRVERNGAFFGVEDMVEDGDDYFLARLGRDPNGALYKMYNDLSSASSNEKKSRKWEGTDDLTALVASLNEALPLATRTRYAWDHLDLPQTAGYFATMALSSSQDLGHKNYYLYHDNDGTGEWAIFPWDVDLTWGRNWVDSIGYMSDILYQTNVLNFYDPVQQGKPSNRLFDLFLASPDFRQMYLRRLRTLMDTILMPAGTPPNQLVIEPLIRQYEDLVQPTNIVPSDAILDFEAWAPWGWGNTNLAIMRVEAERTISTHLTGRRTFLFNSPKATLNGSPIPPAQPPATALAIASWDCNPPSGNHDEQYVELRNTNAIAVDVSGWRLTGAISITLRAGTVVPAAESLYLSPNVNAFRARTNGPSGGQGLFVQGAYSGYLSARGDSPLFLRSAAGLLVSSNSSASFPSTPFVTGNLAVVRLGDGSEPLSSRGNSIFIDQYSPAGAFVSTVSIPNYGASALLASGGASSEGALTRSADGRLLAVAGYNLALTNSASSLPNSSATAVPRAVGVIDPAGAFTLVATTTNQYGMNNVRSAATDGWGNYWAAGANSGTCYLGDGAPASIQTTVPSSRVLQLFDGSLYFSAASDTPGVWALTGAPVIPTATLQLALETGAGSSPFGFAFSPDFRTAYVADDTLAGLGGIQRWDRIAGIWSLSYVFAGLTNVGARGLAADFSAASPVVYATTAESGPNRLVRLTDSGAASPVSTLAQAGASQVFRGIAFAPAASLVPRFIGFGLDADGVHLSWTSLANRSYVLQCADQLPSANWIVLSNLAAVGPTLSLVTEAPPAGTNRFYRVLAR